MDEGVKNNDALIMLKGRVSQKYAVNIDKNGFDRVKKVVDTYNEMHKDRKLDIVFEQNKSL